MRYLIELPIPIGKMLDTSLDRGLWAETDVSNEVIDIGIGGWDISKLHGHQSFLGSFAESFFKATDEVIQLNRLIVANVIDPIGGAGCSWIGLRRVPS